MNLTFRAVFAGLLGITLALTACKNSNSQQVQQQHGKDTSHVAADTISAKIEWYSAYIMGHPLDANAYWNRGKLEALQKKYTRAEKDFTETVKIDSTKDKYYNSLADAEFVLGHTRESKAAFEKCIVLNPANTDALLKLGEIYFYVKKYKDAIELTDKALRINVHLAKAYFMKGMIFLEVHDTTKAISSLQTAIEQNSSYFDADIQLGLIYSRKGSIHAVDYFNAALNADPHSVEPYYDKGMFYQTKGDYDNAINSYTQLLQLDSTYKFALYNLGFIYYLNGKDYKKGIYYFSKAIKSDTSYTMAYYARGNCYQEMNDLANAETDFAHAIKQRPDFVEAQASYKEVKAKLK